MDKKQIIEKIKEVIPFIKENIALDYLVLFGSYAKGTNRQDSDIDLAIVSSNLPRGILNDNTRNILIKLHGVDSSFEPHFYRTEKWENPTKDSFIDYIKKYGEVIYSNGHE